MKRWVLIVACLLLTVSNSFAAESLTQTLYVAENGTFVEYAASANKPAVGYGSLRLLKLAFVTAANGSFAATALSWPIDGMILKLVMVPGGTTPDSSCDFVLLDSASIDVFGGALTGVDGTGTLTKAPLIQSGVTGPAPAGGALSFDVTSNTTGDAAGTLWIYFIQ
jgi:hypothetical protein